MTIKPKKVNSSRSEAAKHRSRSAAAKKAAATRARNRAASEAAGLDETQVQVSDRQESAEARAPGRVNTEGRGRRRRIPLGTPELKLVADVGPGYVGRWINDMGGRIARAQEGGWEFALDHAIDAEDKRRSRVVGTQDNGNPMTAYLMMIREEFYDEDQALKQVPLDEMDAAMRRGVPQGAEDRDQSGFYVPDEGINISRD